MSLVASTGGYKRDSAAVLRAVSQLSVVEIQICSRSLSAKSEPCPGKYRAQGTQPHCGDVRPTQLPSRCLQNQRGYYYHRRGGPFRTRLSVDSKLYPLD